MKWNKGEREDGTDSFAVQVADEHHWPEMEVLVCVVSDKKKTTSSTAGMQTSWATSKLLKVPITQTFFLLQLCGKCVTCLLTVVSDTVLHCLRSTALSMLSTAAFTRLRMPSAHEITMRLPA